MEKMQPNKAAKKKKAGKKNANSKQSTVVDVPGSNENNESTTTSTAANDASANSLQRQTEDQHLEAIRRLAELNISKQKDVHPFWDLMPVPKKDENINSKVVGHPIDKEKTVEEVRQVPYKLPSPYYWAVCDLDDPVIMKDVYNLLCESYVEDSDESFRFRYSEEFIRWSLTPPGYIKDWIIGVRVEGSNQLLAFITGIPVTLMVHEDKLKMAEVNFLCVHKSLRSKRLAPVLIKEVTRRVNLLGIWQAIYTAGVIISKPVAIAHYWHRSLNQKKLLDIGFCSIRNKMTLKMTLKLYKVDPEPKLTGLREMTSEDVPAVHQLLNKYLSKYKLYPIYSEEDILHWFTPRPGVIYTYVREIEGKVTDFVSFYDLPSTVIKSEVHPVLKAAYSFFNVNSTVSMKELVYAAICIAKKLDFDVYNALDIMENRTIFQDLKFNIGDGNLQYYLFNWLCPTLESNEVATVLM